jgi:hypothetical protein
MNSISNATKATLSNMATIAMVATSVLLMPVSASATTLIDQQDGNRFMAIASSSNSWVVAQNFNSYDAMKFTANAYPFTFSVNVRAVLNSSPMDASTFTCNFYDGQNQTWVTSQYGRSISTIAADAASISCQITVTGGGQSEFEVGSARTNLNFGRVRYIVAAPPIGGGSGGSGGSSGSSPRPATSRYEGPEILAVDTFRPVTSGEKLVFTGRNLSAVSSATIGSKTASLSFDAKAGLSIGTPEGLTPGKYDLVMKSSYGTLTHINAVTIKAPTPTVTTGFRSDAQHLSEKQVLDLVAFNKTLSADYEKVRCIVNAADEKTAKRIADLVCAQVARGEARNVEVIKDIRTSYSGDGFWVRVYAKG